MTNPRILSVGNVKVFIANPRAVDQETLAMAQAMYSRTHRSIGERLPELFAGDTAEQSEKEAQLKKALSSYYLNYGHRSIADCGNVTVFFEGVSQLFAKAVEDDALFRGQETSTRYIDYAEQRCSEHTPIEVQAVANAWLDFYARWQPAVLEGVMAASIAKDGPQPDATAQEGRIWLNACKARTFDIMRGFLPAGSTTNVAWTGSLRVVGEKLEELIRHPLAEVHAVAEVLLERLSELMPSAFRPLAVLATNENIHAYSSRQLGSSEGGSCLHFAALMSMPEKASMHRVLEQRERGQAVPRIYDGVAACEISGELDFGSFRDLQRHRPLSVPMPLLQAGKLHQWYVESALAHLNKANRALFVGALADLSAEMFSLTDQFDEMDMQYAVPLATLVPVHAIGPLSKMIYMLEMRSGKTVHSTLRAFAIERAQGINSDFGSEIVRCDLSELDALYLVRGQQTFQSEL